MAGDSRKVISAKVSSRAARGWRSFCEANGITISAMIEVAGEQLAGETAPPAVEERRVMVEKARALDAKRRTRRSQ